MNRLPLTPSLFLASQSPRRKQLLESLGLQFSVLKFETEEVHPTTSNYREIILENARKKAEAGLSKVKEAKAVVLSADTLVVLEDVVLGKPKDKEDARKMLQKLSGKVQQVFTGLVLSSKEFGFRESLIESKVFFRKLSDKEIESYVSTIEPYDKAGAYAVQGIGAVFIDKIEGSYTNVMGLPVETLLTELEALTNIPLFQWIPAKTP